MKKSRIIPVLLLKNGWLVQSKEFSRHQNLGNPVTAVKRLSEWGSDELIYLDISKDDVYDLRRNDLGHPNRNSFVQIIEDVSKVAFMPITVGGKIRRIQDIESYLSLGADKVSINSQAIIDKSFVELASKRFGSQCIVISVDVKKNDFGDYFVYDHLNKKCTDLNPIEWVSMLEDLGAGEILLNSVDNDGMNCGYDIELINSVVNSTSIPVIACGGVGDWSDFEDGMLNSNADAFAAANIFHFKDQSVFLAKQYLSSRGLNVRKPNLIEVKKL
jgi:cyclase